MAPRIRIRDRADIVCTAHTHAFGEWVVKTPASCTANGESTRTCACGETETRVDKATGHVDANKDGKCDTCGQVISPKTGDSSAVVLWLGMMGMTALVGAALVLGKKRRA